MLNRVLSYGVLKLIGMISSIVYVVYLGRLLTPDKLGVYYLVVTFLSLFSLLARLGFDNYLVKRISILSHNKAGSQINSLVRDVSIIILKSSFLLMIVFGISTPILDKYFFDDSGVEIYLLISIAPLYLYSMVFIFSEVFKSLDEYKTSVLFPSVIYPSSSLFFVWVSYDYMGDLALYFGICFGSLISYALAYKLLKRKICLDKHEKDKVAIPFQKNFFLISLSNYIFASVDTLFLGLLSTNADVGVFSILLRLALPFSILLIVINNVFSRKFSILNDGGKAQESYNLYYKLVYSSIGVGIMYLLVIIFFGESMLTFFGQEYNYGYDALIIIGLANFVLLATGPSASILMMSGKEKGYKDILVFTGILNVIISPILIHFYGLIGASISMGFVLSIKNILSFRMVKNHLRFNL